MLSKPTSTRTTSSSSGRSSGGDGGGAAESSGASRDGNKQAKVADVLQGKYINQFLMPLKNLKTTSIVRQTNSKGVDGLISSMESNGYMESGAISVIVEGVEGASDFTAEDALTKIGYILDGNHRAKAALKVFGGEKLIPCRCYRDIDDKHVKKLVANACNQTTEAIARTTVYDQLYFYSSYMRDFQDESSSSSHPKNISLSHMKEPYRKAGICPPSDSTLRNWKKVVEGTGNPALEALQGLAQSTDPKVDLKPFTLRYLVRQDFLSLKDSPKEQALRLQILARFSVHNKKLPSDRDHDEIIKRAKDVAQWVDDLEAIIPRRVWSQELKKHVENYAFKDPSSWERFLQSHFAQIDDEIKRLERNLPAHSPHLDDWVVKTVRSQQCGLVRKAIENDPTMRSLYGEYEKKYEKAKNDVNAKKIQVAQPISPAKPVDATEAKDDNSSDSEDDDGGSELLFCAVCNPPQTTRYYCPDCAVRHIGDCQNAEMAEKDGSEMQKTRRCLDCTKSSPPSAVRTLRSKRAADTVGAAETSGGECASKGKGPAGNRKKRAKITRSVTTPTLPPEADSDVAIKLACRAKNARLHDQVFLSPKTTDAELQEVVQLAQPAKLVFISIAAEKTLLLHKSPGANNRLKSILSAIAQVSCLHAQGTVVLAIPTPHHIHLTPLNDALTNPGTALVVEDHGLFVEYVTRGGGRLASEKMEHLRGGVARFMIAHNNNDTRAGKFKCNTRVTVDDISGTAPSQSRTDTSLMKDVSFPGANIHFPDRVSRFFINRFTAQGDTVMTCSGDRDRVVECALSLGRKVEVFAADSDNLDALNARIATAFDSAFRAGYFTKHMSVDASKPLQVSVKQEGTVDVFEMQVHLAANAQARHHDAKP